jgi:exodeoxyribonuclease VII large subunit
MVRRPSAPGPGADPPERRVLVRAGAGWQLRAAHGESYTVAAVNALARELIESALPPLWVEGEVSGWRRHGSGHCYFSLKDAGAQLRAVMFRADAQRLPTDPDDGMHVRALGTLTLYERRGEYQFVVRDLETRGAGGLWRLAFERLRARLEAEGLLAPERKRGLPRHPSVLGVVTSPVGAALHDIVNVVARRAPWTRIVFAPARVQGDGAALDVARAIALFGAAPDVEVLIVGRGGGSVEDLWTFNEEPVARAIAASPVPVISAVGHEVDVTIADLVADHRAPTPSAAAELAVPDAAAVARELDALADRLVRALRRPVETQAGALADLEDRLREEMRAHVQRREQRLAAAAGRLEALSPLSALRRGYAVPQDGAGRILRTASAFEPGGTVLLRVVDGRVRLQTLDAEADAAP